MAQINDGRRSSHEEEAVTQIIQFNELAGKDGFLIKECENIVLSPSLLSQRSGESKFKFRNFVDYSWDMHHGNGNIMSTHIGGKFIAYAVKVASVGAIRVVDLETNERVLMKGARGIIRDVEFMHKEDELVVGFIDEYGTFYVHRIKKDHKTGKLEQVPIIQVNLDGTGKSDVRRFIWCKFVPDDTNDANSAKDCAFHFAVLQNDIVYVSNLIQILTKFGEGPHSMADIKGFYMTIDTHCSPVVDASFAPDGTALATASKDGTVKFFQVYLLGEETPRCLYSWSPHDGKPVSKIFFLDDHSPNTNSDSQYWKFMLTANEDMSEIKLWTCKTWKCLQILKFNSPGTSPSPKRALLRMELDVTAHYLVINDVHNKTLYILHLSHNDDFARFDWATEFIFPVQILGLNVAMCDVMTKLQMLDKGLDTLVGDDNQPRSPGLPAEEFVVVEIYFVQPKSLQEGSIAFRAPTHSCKPNGNSRISFNKSISFDDATEVEIPTENDVPRSRSPSRERSSSPKRSLSNNSASQQEKRSSVTQMTEQLTNLMGLGLGIGVGVSVASPVRSSSRNKSPSPFQRISESKHFETDQLLISLAHTNGSASKTSSSSSPSREVEEILSPKNSSLFGGLNAGDLLGSSDSVGTMNNSQLIDIDGNDNISEPHLETRHTPSKTNSVTATGQKAKLSGSVQDFPIVLEQVNTIMEMMKAQSHEIKELKRELCKVAVNKVGPKEDGLAESMRAHFVHSQQQMNRLEEALRTVEILEKQKFQSQNQIPSNLAEVLAASIGNVVKTEIEKNVTPAILHSFEPRRNQINIQVQKMVEHAEVKIKQDMRQVIQSGGFKEAIIPEVGNAIKSVCEGVVQELFVTTIIPRFEKALQGIFSQINDAFTKGTKEYITGLEAVMEHERKHDTTKDTIRTQLGGLEDSLSNLLRAELEEQMLRVISSMQGGVVKQIEQSMSKELEKAFKEQQRYFEISVVPRALTPAVSLSDHGTSNVVLQDPATVRKHLVAMCNNGNISEAFSQACSRADHETMMYLCKHVQASKVLTSKLPTSIHLSILQQLSTDLMTDTETKLSYLNTGIGSLDLTDAKTVQIISRIIPIFQVSVKKYATANPDSKLLNSIKLLEMAFLGIGGRSQQQASTSQEFPLAAFKREPLY